MQTAARVMRFLGFGFENGLPGIAAAITCAIHHATGVRVRELPVRVEDLLRSEVD